jgi:superfamily II DNA or RNA helicase
MGVDGTAPVEVLAVEWFGDTALNLTYRGTNGPASKILYRDDEASLGLASAGRAFAFDRDGETFRLASEAQRIRLAYLFDPFMAVETSRIEALPHQITAVYGEMLPRQPLRFLLADDPGAGKTIMAGLLVKELLIRGDLERCLIVAPGSLVEQWQDELSEKFELAFDILTRDQIENSRTGNPFAERDRMILRLDMAARSDELKAKLEVAPEWDLIICDEAHRMSASLFGNEVKYTKRYLLGQLLGSRTRHFLLMSATPHNGKEADFQLFMGLLDADRFETRGRDGNRKADTSDLMRRLTKEELRKFDGSPLFPERRAYTVEYQLSPLEAELYTAVTRYVREEMNRADRLVGDGRRKNSVGFALQILQRRLASSPAAIFQSLKRRRERLETRLDEERLVARGDGALRTQPTTALAPDEEDYEELGGEELEETEEEIVDQATAAQTIAELETEIRSLLELERLADRLVQSGEDAKWQQLSSILDRPPMVDPATGARRKLLIFTEPKDTLNYLAARIMQRIGKSDAVAVLHGGVPRERRRAVIAAFNDDPEVRVLIANDAAGEGVNLQRGAHLMVNYDLPWNPNRLEQRFGRIHRIGQTEVCHLWNLVAGETREGEVYLKLLEKIEEARKALGGRVYDVLGELFEGRPLRELLMDAVRYGEQPEVRQRLFTAVEGAVDVDAIKALVQQRKLTSEGLDPTTINTIREEMERAEVRRLQPRYIRSFFEAAFERVGGQLRRREPGRYEIVRVPATLRERDRIAGRGDPVLPRYERVCFEKQHSDGKPRAAVVAPGHPLLDSLVAVTLDRAGDVLRQGAILVDETGRFEEPQVLVMLEHAVRDGRTDRSGRPHLLSQRLQFVLLDKTGRTIDAGPAPHLDVRPLELDEHDAAKKLASDDWLSGDLERKAVAHAVTDLVPEHLNEIRARRLAEVDRVEQEVKHRLTRAINWWDKRAEELRLQEQAGKPQRLNSGNAAATAQRLSDRLRMRLGELEAERTISALPPQVKGAALILPVAMLRQSQPTASLVAEKAARDECERLAMQSVMAAERAAGRVPVDVSAQKVGYDIESRHPKTDEVRFIEVKGRHEDAEEIIVTRNEILTALNAGDRFWLALVRVANGDATEPHYMQQPFGREPDFGSTAVVYSIGDLVAQSKAA